VKASGEGKHTPRPPLDYLRATTRTVAAHPCSAEYARREKSNFCQSELEKENPRLYALPGWINLAQQGRVNLAQR
jgi:hypothetical protein